jgi:hypothetical protein
MPHVAQSRDRARQVGRRYSPTAAPDKCAEIGGLRHAPLGRSSPTGTVNVPLSKSELGLAGHFGSSTNVPAAVVSLSLDSDASLPSFRKYEEALAQDLPLDRRRSFFLCAREVVILG